MAQFGWAYIDCDDFENSGSEGPPNSLQFVTESGGATTGSALLTYYTASTYSYLPSTMVLSGTLLITGGISASYYHIEDISIIDATGSTFFGDDQADVHVRTGSLEMYNDSSLIFKIDALDTGAVSGSGALQMVGATTLGSTLNVSGNVGISTTPAAALHVYKAAASADHTPMELLRLEQQDEGVDMSAGHGPAITFYVGETGGSDRGGMLAVVREEQGDADSAAAMSFYTAGDDSAPTEKMRITSTGKVGINTTGPTHLLTVDGTISGSGQTTLGANMLISGDQYGGGTLNVTGAVTLAGPASGSAAGPGSYLSVTPAGLLVLDEPHVGILPLTVETRGDGQTISAATGFCVVTAGNATVTLSSPTVGKELAVKLSASVGYVTLNAAGGTTVENGNSILLESTGSAVQLIGQDTQSWWVV